MNQNKKNQPCTTFFYQMANTCFRSLKEFLFSLGSSQRNSYPYSFGNAKCTFRGAKLTKTLMKWHLINTTIMTLIENEKNKEYNSIRSIELSSRNDMRPGLYSSPQPKAGCLRRSRRNCRLELPGLTQFRIYLIFFRKIQWKFLLWIMEIDGYYTI